MSAAIDPPVVGHDPDGKPLDAAAWVRWESEHPGAAQLDFGDGHPAGNDQEYGAEAGSGADAESALGDHTASPSDSGGPTARTKQPEHESSGAAS